MPERIFFKTQGVMVTSTRFVVAEKTYAMHEILSIQAKYIPGVTNESDSYQIHVVTSSQEIKALEANDGDLMMKVKNALDEAIISRG